MRRPSARLVPIVTLAALAGACAAPRTAPAPVPLPPAPWSGAHLGGDAVPTVYRTEWRRAANRAGCALVAPRALGAGEGAVPRRAEFSGGWAVAYDRGGVRSAFGVAGTGTTADGDLHAWPDTLRWADGSEAHYGPEGGTGPNELAYLRIAGQRCLYNVWSRLGRAHLERLLAELRRVD